MAIFESYCHSELAVFHPDSVAVAVLHLVCSHGTDRVFRLTAPGRGPLMLPADERCPEYTIMISWPQEYRSRKSYLWQDARCQKSSPTRENGRLWLAGPSCLPLVGTERKRFTETVDPELPP
jgi:hypothetical protein